MRSELATQSKELIAIATSSSPNAAAGLARSKGYRHDQAQSCRYLAILRRDYGMEEFQKFVNYYGFIFDPEIPLAHKSEKLHADGRLVPGPSAARTYNLLMIWQIGDTTDFFFRALEECGYSGSLLVSTINIPTGMTITETGQVDGLIVANCWDEDVTYRVEAVQSCSKKKIPWFEWDGSYTSERNLSPVFVEQFSKYLKENFPLS